MDATLFRSLVENLSYLTSTRPDIMYASSLHSRFMQNPTQIHLGATKRVLRYLQGILDFSIRYKKGEKLELYGYTDSDWAGSVDDKKSTSGYAFLLGSGVISWLSKKQETVALSSVEAEYVAASLATSHVLWLRKILGEMEEKQKSSTTLFCDNKSAISMTKNPVYQSQTKHINVKHNFIREAVENGVIEMRHDES